MLGLLIGSFSSIVLFIGFLRGSTDSCRMSYAVAITGLSFVLDSLRSEYIRSLLVPVPCFHMLTFCLGDSSRVCHFARLF